MFKLFNLFVDKSRPARGEWIERTLPAEVQATLARLAPQGASGLKGPAWMPTAAVEGLAPQGASGLKVRIAFDAEQQKGRSRPARGEWIERRPILTAMYGTVMSRPARGEWIERLRPARMP